MTRMILLMLGALLCAPAHAADVSIPIVMYRAQQARWDGVPRFPQSSGWHVLMMRPVEMGANTGVVTFLSYWRADRRCWGQVQDCRPASWAVGQNLSYVGPVQNAALSVEIRQ